MDLDAFWELIERSRQETSSPAARLQWLQEQLVRQPTVEIVDFQIWIADSGGGLTPGSCGARPT